ncbi:MAG: hypothetical protein HOQ28_05925 [Thermoleophilia bacterium]|nr:hypothetical protein [Thermoleophilia bacterium]
MRTLTSPILVVAVLAALVAGCGGGGGGGSSSGTPNGGGGVNGISVGNCLNEDEDFLVQPSQTTLDGQSPAGVSFTLTLYKDSAAAQAAAAKKNKKFTAVVENGVIDFRGNPSAIAGAPPAKISKVELNAIKRCMEKAKG